MDFQCYLKKRMGTLQMLVRKEKRPDFPGVVLQNFFICLAAASGASTGAAQYTLSDTFA